MDGSAVQSFRRTSFSCVFKILACSKWYLALQCFSLPAWFILQAERLADMTDLERNLEQSQARLLQLEEEREAADAQLAEAAAQLKSLTADLAAAKDEALLCTQDLEAAEVRW
jgi:septal ring factor EnvC (AmiA/AmiB activator)